MTAQTAPRRRRRRGRPAAPALAALAAATALGACSGDGTRVYDARVYSTYQANELRAAGTYPLAVLGTPPDGSSAEEVAAAMRLPEHMGGTELVLAPPDAQGRRLVIAFVEGTPDWACKWTAAPEGEPSPGPLRATFAWCRDADVMSGAQMASGRTRGPRDDAFVPAIHQLYASALPRRSPNKSSPGR